MDPGNFIRMRSIPTIYAHRLNDNNEPVLWEYNSISWDFRPNKIEDRQAIQIVAVGHYAN